MYLQFRGQIYYFVIETKTNSTNETHFRDYFPNRLMPTSA